jgi:hypothetical protein
MTTPKKSKYNRSQFSVYWDTETKQFSVTYHSPKMLQKKSAYTETKEEQDFIALLFKKDKMGIDWAITDYKELVRIATKNDPRYKRKNPLHTKSGIYAQNIRHLEQLIATVKENRHPYMVELKHPAPIAKPKSYTIHAFNPYEALGIILSQIHSHKNKDKEKPLRPYRITDATTGEVVWVCYTLHHQQLKEATTTTTNNKTQ